MGRIYTKSCGVYMDQFDFSGVSNAVTLDIGNPLAPVTAYADVDATYVEGKPGFTCEVKGMYSIASPDFDGQLFSILTTAQRYIGIYPGGRTKGQYGYEMRSMISASPRHAAAASVVACDVTWRGELPIVRGPLLDVDTAVAASGNGTAYQMGAVAAAETLVGVLRLLAAPAGAGNNTLDVIVQSDDNEAFTSPTTRLTFTQLNQATGPTVEVPTAAGAITDTWWRVNYTYAGAGSRTFSLVIALGIRKT